MPTVEVLLQGYSTVSNQGSLGFCGVYLVDRRVLFDCGHAGRRRALLAALADRDLEPAAIETVVLSHAHWDHVQNVDLFDRARVLVHTDELGYLDTTPRHDPVMPPWTKQILAMVDTRPTGEGDEVAPGVRVIDLPGHSPGSIGLTVPTEHGLSVLTGDAVPSAKALRAGRLTNVFFDAAAADASLARVRHLAEVVYPGHDFPFRPGTR
ncbi:MAG TPA: MBL fold metallo-hydrolase [Pseudonocardiaceae bacterium]|jgi:glyoxylase-like metal-dependent hydrolase (beta-lactamase superfamily II)|nr:MBL fold metallo-hydrolase [Pseudonocardiaceae bacterium]